MGKRNGTGASEKSCGIIVVNEAMEYLILRHRPGHWDFPKGHVEKGETEEETALREILEETGLEVRILPDFRETVNYLVKGHIPKEVVYFLGRPQGGEIILQKEEVSDHVFLSYDQARKQLTFDSNRRLLDKAHAFMKKNHETTGHHES